LAEALDEVPTRLLAFCLLPNHFHLVLWPRTDDELSRFVGWLTLTHTQRWHAHYHNVGTGHLYQGRFKSFPVAADEHLLTVLHYAERNPVRAGLVERRRKGDADIFEPQNVRVPFSSRCNFRRSPTRFKCVTSGTAVIAPQWVGCFLFSRGTPPCPVPPSRCSARPSAALPGLAFAAPGRPPWRHWRTVRSPARVPSQMNCWCSS